MSPIPDDFEQLRRLLALKRHEQPPPGYFHSFSRQVIVRIESGEIGDPVAASFWSFSGGSFLQRIWATLDARPVLAGAFGVAVCGFFVVGALMSDNTGNAIATQLPPQPVHLAEQSPPLWEQSNASAQFTSSLTGGGVPNYEPPANSLFEQIRKAQASPQSLRQSGLPTPVQVSFP